MKWCYGLLFAHWSQRKESPGPWSLLQDLLLLESFQLFAFRYIYCSQINQKLGILKISMETLS